MHIKPSYRSAFLVLNFCLACFSLFCSTVILAESNKIHLQWDNEKSTKVSYKTEITDIAESNLLGFTGFEILENPKLEVDVINTILNTAPTQPQSRTALHSLNNGNFRVEISYIEIEYDKPAENKLENMLRDRHKNMIGSVWLRGQIDSSGKVQSFYLPPAHSSILSKFFSFPEYPVEIGSTWSIPVALIKFGGNFQTNDQKRINKVTIVNIQEENNETIATVFYNVSEYVEGGFRTGNKDELVKQMSVASFIALGEFVVNKHYWRRFRGFLVEEQEGRITVKKTKSYSLEPDL